MKNRAREQNQVSEPHGARLAEALARRRIFKDRTAAWIVRAGGIAVIAAVLGIFVFLVSEAAPLLSATRVTVSGTIPTHAATARALVIDEHRTHVAMLSVDGQVRVFRTADGSLVETRLLIPPSRNARITAVDAPAGESLLAAATSDGRLLLLRIDWRLDYADGVRVVTPELGEPVELALDPAGEPIEVFAARGSEEGTTAVGKLTDGSLTVIRQELERNAFTGETRVSVHRSLLEPPSQVRHLVLDPEQRNLYAAADGGRLLWWDLGGGGATPSAETAPGESEVSALGLLIGGRGLAVGREDGSLGIWVRTRRGRARTELMQIHAFDGSGEAIQRIAPSARDRSFLVQSEGGGLGLFYSTSHRELWRGNASTPDVMALAYAPKGDGVYVGLRDRIVGLDVHNPHGEISLRSLFAKVWYEAYPEPAYVWQSTGGTDEFEPKLSLTPLLVGTLKGTAFALVLAIPLGILGALYTSQFLHPRYQRIVKPTVEIMASLPSVVLGFLAGLWLAPRLEHALPGLLLMLVALPALFLLTGAVWNRFPRRWTGYLPQGSELFVLAGVTLAGMALCLSWSQPFETLCFGGDFSSWLREATGLSFDQRNAIVVGIAMGFAVIPIIFSLADDAISGVPRNIAAGSLALGASRWQTVVRVVLPVASPGLFAATMIGFGRAVGETMIVLMATGNTPILDWNPFNGFRALSANIAVEIPEAPQGGTLYRTLFVAALLLFALTFVVNTVSELVRQRLRKRFKAL